MWDCRCMLEGSFQSRTFSISSAQSGQRRESIPARPKPSVKVLVTPSEDRYAVARNILAAVPVPWISFMIYCKHQPSLYDRSVWPFLFATHVLVQGGCLNCSSGGCSQVADGVRKFQHDSRKSGTLRIHLFGENVSVMCESKTKEHSSNTLGLSMFLIYVQICWCFTLNDQKLKPGRWDKKTPIWLLQKTPPENSLLHQLEMHCCDKRASWIQTQQYHLLAVSFNVF